MKGLHSWASQLLLLADETDWSSVQTYKERVSFIREFLEKIDLTCSSVAISSVACGDRFRLLLYKLG